MSDKKKMVNNKEQKGRKLPLGVLYFVYLSYCLKRNKSNIYTFEHVCGFVLKNNTTASTLFLLFKKKVSAICLYSDGTPLAFETKVTKD